MQGLYSWLYRHRLWNAVLLLIYFICVVLPHEWIGVNISKLFKSVSREVYDNTILGISSLVALLILVPLYRRVNQLDKQGEFWIFLGVTLGLIVLCLNTIIIVNIELIHIFQYGVFAILAFPLFRHYTLTLICTTLFGAIDEGYQYFLLSPERTDYYDLNDVVFNTLGGAVGLLWIKSYGIKSVKRSVKEVALSFPIVSTLALLSLIGLSIAFGYMAYYPTEGIEPILTWVREVPNSFWKSLRGGKIIYHIILPLEGIVYTVILWGFYSMLDR